jgi:glutamate dehydrogenase (NAD(P)+)
MLRRIRNDSRRPLSGLHHGKRSHGGSLGRTESTGFGVIFTLREALKELGMTWRRPRRGAGLRQRGAVSVQLYTELGCTVSRTPVGSGDKTSYTFRKADGISLKELRGISDKFGGIDKARARDLGYEMLPGGAWLEQDVDVLIPAALENQINRETVEKIAKRVKVVAEGANGPTTPEADEVIKQRGIFVLPDFLTNAGGVTCSYFEQVQCNTNYYWEKDEVLAKLDTKMTAAFAAVYDLAKRQKLYMRDAAYMIAINRVAEAVKQRGWA